MTNHQGCLTNHCSFFNASNDIAVLQITSALDWNIMSTTIHLEISHALFVSLFLCLTNKNSIGRKRRMSYFVFSSNAHA